MKTPIPDDLHEMYQLRWLRMTDGTDSEDNVNSAEGE